MEKGSNTKNILLIGPTGVGKTEIARRLAQLSGSPFLKVEATKFTEVGYVGKNVDSMIRDLVEIAVNMVKQEKIKEVEPKVKDLVEERILEALVPSKKQNIPFANIFGFQAAFQGQQEQPEEVDIRRKRAELREKLRNGELEDMEIEIDVEVSQPGVGFIGMPDMEDMGIDFSQILGNILPKQKKKRRMKISEARRILTPIESEKLIDMDEVIQKALTLAQERGIIFIDELDKIAATGQGHGPDVSRQGVQRDLLPIVEGTTVTTRYGPVRTDYILFIGAGAFHMSKPSDLIPELQGRFPIRVELEPLKEEDFVRILTEPENASCHQQPSVTEFHIRPLSTNDTYCPSPIIMWSSTGIPINSPASLRRRVIFKSSELGCGSPDGWLCTRSIAAAELSSAAFRTSLACTIL